MTDTPGPNNPRNEPLPHAAAPQSPSLTKYFVASVLLIIPCGNLLFGVLSLVFTFLAKSDYENSRASDGESKLKITKILLIIGYVLAVLGLLAWAGLVAIGAANSDSITTSTTFDF